jgi:hypothetical protein
VVAPKLRFQDEDGAWLPANPGTETFSLLPFIERMWKTPPLSEVILAILIH